MIYALTIDEKTFAPAKISSIGQLLNIVLPIASAGAALIFLVMMFRGALMWITNGDNPEALKKAQATLVFSGIGLIIVIVSFLAVQLIGKLLGIDKLI